MVPQTGSLSEAVLMWLPSWPNRFGAGRHHARRGWVAAGSRGGRRARRLSVERLEDRLAPAAGALDPTFGTGGMVITDFENGSDIGKAQALQTDGKIVVVGSTSSGGGGINFGLARYLADGT